MLEKVLIANRGEIACRIVRTARKLGIATVAVVSEADRHALHARAADEMVEIGGAPAAESYLRIDRIIAAARHTGADSIHPGYGFLAENAEFAAACAEAGITFIGPSPDAMRRLGGKAEAKAIAQAECVPTVPGYNGDKQDAKTLAREARRIGFPMVIKAVAGGGGRGMRMVERDEDFSALLESAQREANSAFGDGTVLLEKRILSPRHVEVQVFGDSHGNVVHLYERDCSLQRRHQKVVEEAPAPGMSAALRDKITAAAVKLAKSVGYQGAGTVEFLVEGGALSADAPWYFIEMNTRLQVEHPVTEAVTGLDLVEWQFRVAAGEPLPVAQDGICLNGHAIEARLCAEDPAKGFMPSVGRIVAWQEPTGAGLRIDTGVAAGGEVTPYYDSMIAKVIAHGADRTQALARVRDGLARMLVAGPRTNASFLHRLLGNPDVVAGRVETGLIERELRALTAPRPEALETALCAGIAALLDHTRSSIETTRARFASDAASPWSAGDAFQLGGARRLSLPVLVDGQKVLFDVAWRPGEARPSVSRTAEEKPGRPAAAGRSAEPDVEGAASSGAVRLIPDGPRFLLLHDLRQTVLAWPQYGTDEEDDGAGGTLRAPINGRVTKVLVSAGARITKGTPVAVVEAMKMEHVLAAPIDGTVAELIAVEGAQVVAGTMLARIAEG